MVSGNSHRSLTNYALNLYSKITGRSTPIYVKSKMIMNEVAEPDNYLDLELVDVESPGASGGRDDPHVKRWQDDDDIAHTGAMGFVFAAFNHFIDIKKGPGIFDDYDGYSYRKGSASRDEHQNVEDAYDDSLAEFISRITGHRKVDDAINYYFNDEYVHAPGMEWYRGCSPSVERYSFPGDKGVYKTVELEARARFPLADPIGKSGKGVPYSVFMPLDNLARYWYTVYLYSNPGELHHPALLAPVLHAVQDAIVPHHAAGYNGNWHGSYESDFGNRLHTWLGDKGFEDDVKALYNHWLTGGASPPSQLKENDWQMAPSPSWRIDQIVTWVALNAYHEYSTTYSHFKTKYAFNEDSGKRLAKIASAVALLVFEKSVQDTAGRALAAGKGDREALGRVALRPLNIWNHAVTYDESSAKIAEAKTDADHRCSLFRMTFGLSSGTCVSFESVERPGHYLRHSNFALRLDKFEDTELFRKDATFRPRPGLMNKMCLSFESVNYPNHYIRHKNYRLYIENLAQAKPMDVLLFMSDSTFMPLLR